MSYWSINIRSSSFFFLLLDFLFLLPLIMTRQVNKASYLLIIWISFIDSLRNDNELASMCASKPESCISESAQTCLCQEYKTKTGSLPCALPATKWINIAHRVSTNKPHNERTTEPEIQRGFCLVCVSKLEALYSVGFLRLFGCGQPMLGPKGAKGPPQNARVPEDAVGLPVAPTLIIIFLNRPTSGLAH